MLPPPDETAHPQRWSRRKILLIFIVPLVLLFAALVFYDERLKPSDDLLVPLPAPPAAGTNGFELLDEAWDDFERPDRATLDRWRQIRTRAIPWDDGIVEALNPAGRNLRLDLTTALAAPVWQGEVPSQGNNYNPPYISMFPVSALMADALRQAQKGNFEPALSLTEELRHISKRQIAGSWNLTDFTAAWQNNYLAVAFTCDLAADFDLSSESLSRLAAIWEGGDLQASDLIHPVAGEAYSLKSKLSDLAGLRREIFERLTLRRNEALNHGHRLLRLLLHQGLVPAPSREESLYPALKRDTPVYYNISKYDPGRGRKKFIFEAIAQPVNDAVYIARRYQFQVRAMRLWLAIKRWQMIHPGRTLADFKELIPEFLAAIPPDPWDGQPLQWDAGQQAIYAIGADWIPGLPSLPIENRAWIITDFDEDTVRYAALRLNRPPLPPPPPKPPAAKKPAPKSKPSTP